MTLPLYAIIALFALIAIIYLKSRETVYTQITLMEPGACELSDLVLVRNEMMPKNTMTIEAQTNTESKNVIYHQISTNTGITDIASLKNCQTTLELLEKTLPAAAIKKGKPGIINITRLVLSLSRNLKHLDGAKLLLFCQRDLISGSTVLESRICQKIKKSKEVCAYDEWNSQAEKDMLLC